jgi:hypothetical protein
MEEGNKEMVVKQDVVTLKRLITIPKSVLVEMVEKKYNVKVVKVTLSYVGMAIEVV